MKKIEIEIDMARTRKSRKYYHRSTELKGSVFDFSYKCTQKPSGAISLCSVGCIHDGVHYATGEQWQVTISSSKLDENR